jgi:hypothetical protein
VHERRTEGLLFKEGTPAGPAFCPRFQLSSAASNMTLVKPLHREPPPDRAPVHPAGRPHRCGEAQGARHPERRTPPAPRHHHPPGRKGALCPACRALPPAACLLPTACWPRIVVSSCCATTCCCIRALLPILLTAQAFVGYRDYGREAGDGQYIVQDFVDAESFRRALPPLCLPPGMSFRRPLRLCGCRLAVSKLRRASILP